MKHAIVNQNPQWEFLLPDNIADWDAPSGWEHERLASMQAHLRGGMVLYDIGAEHGWLSAVYGSFAGRGNMVLVEPSPEMWVNIRKTWEFNGFRRPLACVQMFCGATSDALLPASTIAGMWPECSSNWQYDPETPGMAYRLIGDGGTVPIGTTTVDAIASETARPPDAITIDVEGYELAVLRGAQHTLEQGRPLVWVSVHEDLMMKHCGHMPAELLDYMSAMGYTAEYLDTDHEAHFYFRPNGYERT